jgi:hypothetical protein
MIYGVVADKTVGNPFYKRLLGANDHHRYVFAEAKSLYCIKISYRQTYISADQRGARVAWSNKQLIAQFALCALPCYGMFSASTA